MEQKSALLNQLRIDRELPSSRSRRRSPWRWLTLAGILTIALAAGWFIYFAEDGIPVRAAVAHPAPTGTPMESKSLLDASGYVVARRQATVSAKVTGKLVEVLIEEGQHVEKGQIIAKIDDSNSAAGLEQAKANVAEAKANLAAANIAAADSLPTYQRNKKQVAEGLITPEAYDNAKASYDATQAHVQVAQEQLAVAEANLVSAQRTEDDYTLRAPFSGVITMKNAQPGETISPLATGGFTRTGIATLVDMDSLEIEVDVSENFINRIHNGQSATATLSAYPDWHIPATVIAVIPTADRSTSTVKVRLGLRTGDARILPQMGVRVSFLDDKPRIASNSTGVVVPADAVRVTGDTGIVFEIRGNVVRRRTVELGARTAMDQMILSGLSSGERVAIGDLHRLTDGAKVRVEE